MQTIVSAPGKIHLLGEHAVVYGRPALLAAIDKRLYIRIKNLKFKIKNNKKKIIIKGVNDKQLVKYAIEVFQKAFCLDNLPPFEISVTSDIPVGCGIGSSAALAAATVGALMKSVKDLWNPVKINELAFEVEKRIHGQPSGADNTTVVFGGLVWYRREFDFLKSIWSLPISSYKIPKFLIIDTGRPQESTKEMVELVAFYYRKKQKKIEAIFAEQEKMTKSLLLSLREGNFEKLKMVIREGERNLEKMGVVGNFAQKIIREIKDVGGAAKVCGAGGRKKGSGILLCYHENFDKIYQIAPKYKVTVLPVKLGEEGIRLEK